MGITCFQENTSVKLVSDVDKTVRKIPPSEVK